MSTLVDILSARAREQPDVVPFTFLSEVDGIVETMTHRQLDARARAIAALLREHVAPGDRVLLCHAPGLEFITSLFGCFYARALAVPVYPPRPNRPVAARDAIATHAQVSAVLTSQALFDDRQRRSGRTPALLDVPWLVSGSASEAAWTPEDVPADATAMLQFTSGSTNTPKGVVLTHRHLIRNVQIIESHSRTQEGSTGVCWLPPYHDMGLMGGILLPLYAGVHTVLMAPATFLLRPAAWLRAISVYGARYSGSPSFGYELCVQKIGRQARQELDLSCWEVAFNGAEPINPRVLAQFSEAFGPCGFRPETFYPCYGMAEATLFVTGGPRTAPPFVQEFGKAALERREVEARPPGAADGRALVGCGTAPGENRVLIVDPESRREVANGRIGEIWVSGPTVADGYWNLPDETERVFGGRLADTGEGPFLRTGDLGFFHEGALFVTGRLKDLVIVAGRNHYPQDLERTAEASHPLLLTGGAAAFAIEVTESERLVLVCEVERSVARSGNGDEVIRAVVEAVASEHDIAVHAVVLVARGSIPRTSSGKVRRRECRTQFLTGELAAVAAWTAGSARAAAPEVPAGNNASGPQSRSAEEIEAWLTARLAALSGEPAARIDPNKPLSSFNVDSVAAVSLAAELGEWLGRDLPATLAWDHPTVRALAAFLAGSAPAAPRAARPAAEGDAVAIVAFGCRFPGAPDAEGYWALLHGARDGVGEVPAGRWREGSVQAGDTEAAFRQGGFLPRVDGFDAHFFGIAPREAHQLDPQQRLLLEVAWEALENGGMSADGLRGSRTGVFVGISTLDYLQLLVEEGAGGAQPFNPTGASASIAANRISYFLDLRGPSLAIDTACSSSLVAVHEAVKSLLGGECDLALAGGVNLMLSPSPTRSLVKAQMMSPSGRCRTFDAQADGYVRGEGCGLVVLKRLADATAAGDHILAVIKGTAVNQDGQSNGLTAPNGLAQQAVIREALTRAGVAPSEVGYVEAHGTGTPLGDPIEVDALKAVLLEGRDVQRRCALGSVKTNVGHLEAAAGIAGLIKAALALHHEEIPASLHMQALNPRIELAGTPFSIPRIATPWPRGGAARYAGVSSFGFGGTNCHVVLQEAPRREPAGTARQAAAGRPQHVLALSARSRAALHELAGRHAAALETARGVSAADWTFSANTGRSHFPCRLAVVGGTPEELARQLLEHGERKDSSPEADYVPTPRFAFLFTGQGSQYAGMGRQLLQTQPVFRAAIERCAETLDPLMTRPLLSVLQAAEDDGLIHQTAFAQPALFALEYALSEMWRSWGIRPHAVLGHSLGEYVAACVAGVFPLEDGLRLVAARARLMQALPAGGEMAVVFADEGRVAAALRGLPDVSMAALNGPANTVVSGRGEAVQAVRQVLELEGIRSRALRVSHAFHSPLMEPMVAAFTEAASRVRFSAPKIALISNLTGKRVEAAEIGQPGYWARSLREPVRFADGIRELSAMGCALFVEIGPDPTLLAAGMRCLPEGTGSWLPSLRRGKDDWQPLLEGLAAAYTAGAAVDWAAFDRPYGRSRVNVPTYPFQRRRFWIEAAGRRPSRRDVHPVLGERLPALAHVHRDHTWLAEVGNGHGPSLHNGHAGGGYVEAALAAAREAFGPGERVITNLVLHQPMPDPGRGPRSAQFTLRAEGGQGGAFSAYSRGTGAEEAWTLHATAQVREHRAPLVEVSPAPRPPRAEPRNLQFSLMFFASTDDAESGDKYRLVVEGARFADAHGFAAVWVPERHFGKWGCLYPNPSVLHAALARETRRVRLRAGSVVLPLHHPLRVAEEWSMVDNLSGGRVDLSFASGWNPSDFALAPEKYAARHEEVFAGIETVKRLWRGERVAARDGEGREIEVRVYPTPVQPEVGVWVTAAGNPRTFERAGTIGANVLTHLLDHGIEQVAQNIRRYREARARAGHDPQAGQVSLMLHTFVGADVTQVKEQVRGPFCAYLKTLGPALEGLARSRGRTLDPTSPEDADALVAFLFERFFATRALMGTPESCQPLLEELAAAGVDEVACLLDFGPATDEVLEHLPYLERLRAQCASVPSGVTHAPAWERRDAVPLQSGDGPTLEAIRARCAREVAGGEIAGIERLWLGEGEALGSIASGPEGARGPGRLVDAGLRALTAAAKALGGPHAAAEYRAQRIERLHWPEPPAGPAAWAHAIVSTQDPVVGDVRLLDASGERVGEAVGVRLEPVTAARAPEGLPGDWLYELRWEAAPPAAASQDGAGPGAWLLLADEGGLAASLEVALRAAGDSCVRVAEGAGEDEVDALKRALAEAGGGLRGVVHLRGLDAGPLETATAASLAADQERGAGSALRVIQTLAKSGHGARLWLVTRGAQAAGGERGGLAVSQAPLWGLGRTCAMEHPEIWGALVDLDPEARDAEAAAELAGVLGAGGREDQYALRGGRRYVARLARRPAERMDGALPVRGDASYVLTGGHQGVGFEVAQWLVEKGARHIVLLGRSAAPPPANLRALEARGARVRYAQVDVSDEASLRRWWTERGPDEPPVRGVVHAASVWQDAEGHTLVRPLLQLDAAALRTVFAPKVTGSWLLHRLFGPGVLDFFVCFSSAASLMGSAGQGNYAAASAFVDALAHHRQRRGSAALSINWGAIGEVGFGATVEGRRIHEYWETHGIQRLTPGHVRATLEQLLPAKPAQVAVLRTDWALLAQGFPLLRSLPWAAGLVSAGPPARSEDAAALRRALEEAPPSKRPGLLVRHVRDEVARVMGLPPELVDVRRGLFEMGMDSLTALDLKNRLRASVGLDVPATVVFEHPNIEAIAGFLSDQLVGAVPARRAEALEVSEAPEAEPAGAAALARIQGLSDHEVEQQLERP